MLCLLKPEKTKLKLTVWDTTIVTSTDKRTKETKRNSDTQIPHSHKCNSIIREPIYATASLINDKRVTDS